MIRRLHRQADFEDTGEYFSRAFGRSYPLPDYSSWYGGPAEIALADGDAS